MWTIAAFVFALTAFILAIGAFMFSFASFGQNVDRERYLRDMEEKLMRARRITQEHPTDRALTPEQSAQVSPSGLVAQDAYLQQILANKTALH